MKTWFAERRKNKQEIIALVKADKAQRKVTKESIKKLSDDEQKAQKKAIKEEKSAAKAAYKTQIKSATGSEKRKMKKNNRMYRKIWNRPRRGIIWSLVCLLVMFVGFKLGPTVIGLSETISAKDINIDSETPEAKAARAAGEILSEKIADEGIVLLKNEDNSLPLQEKKMNVFGISSFNFRYGGGGSGGSDTSRAISLYEGLNEAGIDYNSDLHDLYLELPEVKDATGKTDTGIMAIVKMMSAGEEDELAIDYLKADVLKEAKAYSNNALISLASTGVESSDMSLTQLELTKNKKALIKKVAENFDNVTVVINAGNTLELGYLEEFPSIKSIVWVGTPGPSGTRSLGNVLAGKINPSGRLTDTYAYDVGSAPATENFGSYAYDNLDKHFVNYQEGIYVGYRFYETYYQNDEAGYQKAVQFPYGHGLSYTDFDWKVLKKDFNKDTISLDVEVTNTGKVSGKDVVQVYFSAPYLVGGLEKSAIELGAYGKTSLLEPGQKETITLTYNTNDMTSYDTKDTEAYILDEGEYQISLAKNVHELVETFTYANKEKVVIKEDEVTGTELQNQFAENANEQTYLSRGDWEATYPSDENLNYTAPKWVLEEATKKTTDSELAMPEFEQENGIKLADLKGLDYDDPKWTEFLSQFTLDEMMDIYTQGAYKTLPLERLGVPGSVMLDGPAGVSFFFKTITAAAYPTEIVIASTWNDELAYAWGEAVGIEAKAMGVHVWYAPAMNVHRTALGGRNFEYFSEDPLLSGKMAAAVTRGAQDQGVIVTIKHFAMNDQETNARSGLYVWADEQAMREIHLKPFEIATKEGNPHGAMSSFSFLNGQWAGGNATLLNNVLRDEWGFEGMVSSDAVFGFMHADKAVVSGNDLMLDTMSRIENKKRLKKAYKVDPSGIATGLHTSLHNIYYALLQTHLMD